MKIHITFYRSKLCPRCYLAGRHLRQLAAADPSLELEEIDILAAPLQTWRAGIRMVPAIKIDQQLLSGILLDKNAIAGFIAAHRP